MKSYSVKEIAELLKTNPETVRRWIRSGKLKSEIDSRKGGNIITEQMLESFLKTMPKYASIAAASLFAPVGFGVAAVAGIGITLVDEYIKSESNKKTKGEPIELVKYLKADIMNRQESIKKKQATIEQLEREIQDEHRTIEGLKAALDTLNGIQMENK